MKSVVVAIGRFNPPHLGHTEMFKKVLTMSRDKKADMKIFVSSAIAKTKSEKLKNPLEFGEKMRYLQEFFPGMPFVRMSTAYDAIHSLGIDGYNTVYIVAGEDRYNSYLQMVNRGMSSADPIKKIIIQNFELIPLKRDPESDNVEGASATLMRKSALDGNFEEFLKFAPPGKPELVRDMYEKVRNTLLKVTNGN